jgi:hypothetical protein
VNGGNCQIQPECAPVPQADGQNELRQLARDYTQIRSTQNVTLPQHENESQRLSEAIANVNERRRLKRDAISVQQGHGERRTTPPQHKHERKREQRSLELLGIIADVIAELEELWGRVASNWSKIKSRTSLALIAGVITQIEELWSDGAPDESKARSISPVSRTPQPVESIDQSHYSYPSPSGPPYVSGGPEICGQILFYGTPVLDSRTGCYVEDGIEVPPGFTVVPNDQLAPNILSAPNQDGFYVPPGYTLVSNDQPVSNSPPAPDRHDTDFSRPVDIAQPTPAHLKYELATFTPQTPYNPYPFQTGKCLATESHAVQVDRGTRKNPKNSTPFTDFGSIDADAFRLPDAIGDEDCDEWTENVKSWRDV